MRQLPSLSCKRPTREINKLRKPTGARARRRGALPRAAWSSDSLLPPLPPPPARLAAVASSASTQRVPSRCVDCRREAATVAPARSVAVGLRKAVRAFSFVLAPLSLSPPSPSPSPELGHRRVGSGECLARALLSGRGGGRGWLRRGRGQRARGSTQRGHGGQGL